MAGVLQVEVVSAEGRLWNGVCTQVQVPILDGSLGILPRRQPLLAALGNGQMTLCTTDGQKRHFTVDGGFVSVDSDFVTVVANSGFES